MGLSSKEKTKLSFVGLKFRFKSSMTVWKGAWYSLGVLSSYLTQRKRPEGVHLKRPQTKDVGFKSGRE